MEMRGRKKTAAKSRNMGDLVYILLIHFRGGDNVAFVRGHDLGFEKQGSKSNLKM